MMFILYLDKMRFRRFSFTSFEHVCWFIPFVMSLRKNALSEWKERPGNSFSTSSLWIINLPLYVSMITNDLLQLFISSTSFEKRKKTKLKGVIVFLIKLVLPLISNFNKKKWYRKRFELWTQVIEHLDYMTNKNRGNFSCKSSSFLDHYYFEQTVYEWE